MTDHTISQTVLDTFYLAHGDTLTIAAGAGLVEDEGYGVVGEGSMSVTVDGYIASNEHGIFLDDSWNAEMAHVAISETGSITSQRGAAVALNAESTSLTNDGTITSESRNSVTVFLDGEVTLENTGTISAHMLTAPHLTAVNIINFASDAENVDHYISNSGRITGYWAIEVYGNRNSDAPLDNVTLQNTGEILSYGDALSFVRMGHIEIVNSGAIQGFDHAVYIASLDSSKYTGEFNIHNTATGEISGTIYIDQIGTANLFNEGTINGSINVEYASTMVSNTGTINGLVEFGNSNSSYEGSATSFVHGVEGGDGDDTLIDGNGDTFFYGHSGSDLLDGNGGDDLLEGGSGNDTLEGGADADELRGGHGNDSLSGGDGDDTLYGDWGYDTLIGGNGNDLLSDSKQENEMYGRAGNDTLLGGNGKDQLFGGSGDDQINGNKGRDKIKGAQGDDTVSGGAGKDKFVFGQSAGTDTVLDFTLDEDRIVLTAYEIDPADFDTVLAPALSDQTDGAFLDLSLLGGEGGVLLLGVTAGTLDADDFVF